MTVRAFLGIVSSLLGIVVCGAAGGIAGYAVIRWLDLTGVLGALLAAAIAMVVATAAWAGGSTLIRVLRPR